MIIRDAMCASILAETFKRLASITAVLVGIDYNPVDMNNKCGRD